MRQTPVAKRVLAVALFCSLSACGDRTPPGAPEGRAAAVTVENVSTLATAPDCCEPGPFTYRMSFRLRETAGVGATLQRVTASLSETSGAAAVSELAGAEAFGTARLEPHGIVTAAAITASWPLLTVTRLTVRITFTDDNGHTGVIETSTPLAFDLTVEWSGALPIKTDPVGDWSHARLSLVQSGDSLTGELVSRDGVRFPVTGSTSAQAPPQLSVVGLPGTSTCAGVILTFTEFEFTVSELRRLAGRAGGRCFGTVAGAFDLQRGG